MISFWCYKHIEIEKSKKWPFYYLFSQHGYAVLLLFNFVFFILHFNCFDSRGTNESGLDEKRIGSYKWKALYFVFCFVLLIVLHWIEEVLGNKQQYVMTYRSFIFQNLLNCCVLHAILFAFSSTFFYLSVTDESFEDGKRVWRTKFSPW